MPGIHRVSFLTFFLCLFLMEMSRAGTIGTPNAELDRLESEVAEAQNALDKELLRTDAKRGSPKEKELEKTVDEKSKALKLFFETNANHPSPKSTDSSDTPSQTREEPAAPVPETVLSSENIPGEIQYQKKRGNTKVSEVSKPSPSETPQPGNVSEIQYPKKKKPTEKN